MFHKFSFSVVVVAAVAAFSPAAHAGLTPVQGDAVAARFSNLYASNAGSRPFGNASLSLGLSALPATTEMPLPLATQLAPVHAGIDASLWNLLAAVRADHHGQQFVFLETNLTHVTLEQERFESAVPLPGAALLFMSGLLGVGGWRIGRRRTPNVAALVPAAA